MINRPVRKNRAAINKLAGHRAEHARVIRAYAVVTHDEVAVFGDTDRPKIAHILVLRRDVRLIDRPPIDIHDALPNLNIFAGQADDALNERFRVVQRIPENHDIAPLNGLKPIDKFVDENTLLVRQEAEPCWFPQPLPADIGTR